MVIVLATDDRHQFPPKKKSSGYTCEKQEFETMLAKYPELCWLSGFEPMELWTSSKISCIKAFGEHASPFDLAIKGIRAIDLFISGEYPDYLELISVMPADRKLLWQQFLLAQSHIQFILDNLLALSKEEMIHCLKLALIISEMSGSKIMKEKAWVYQISDEDDLFLLQKVIERHPELFPTFASMNLEQKQCVSQLLQSIQLDGLFYFTSVYTSMKEIFEQNLVTKKRDLFDLILFVHQCRICARDVGKGQLWGRGLDEKEFQHHQLFRQANLISSVWGIEEGYQYYLSQRSNWLGFQLSTPLERTLTFVGSMLNCYSFEEAEVVKETFLSLDPEDISRLVSDLEFLCSKGDSQYRYFSSVLSHLQKNQKVGRSEQERLAKTIEVAFPMLSKLYFMNQSSKSKSEVPLDFSEIAQMAKCDPELLINRHLKIAKQGKVVVCKKQ